jgi:HEAT repeat protein
MTDESKSHDSAEIDREDRLAQELASNDPSRQLAAIDSILTSSVQSWPSTKLGGAALEALIGCIGSERKSIQRRAIDALAALAAGGDARVITSLKHAMSADNRRARWGAAYALAQIGDDSLAIDAADALCEALGDDDGDIRWAASVLMVRLGRRHRDEIRARMLSLVSSGNPNARKMALYCIRDLAFAGPDLVAVLENAVRDANVHIRLAALSVLAKLDDPSGRSALITLGCLESDSDAGVRRAAAIAMGQVRGSTSRAVPALKIAAASETDPALARAARSALERLEKRT